MPQETAAVDDLVDEINEQPTSTPVEQDLSALSPSYNQLPIFAAVDEQEEPQKQNESPTSLNEKLKPTGFQIGLNDRLAFVNHLFENNNEDFYTVMAVCVFQ